MRFYDETTDDYKPATADDLLRMIGITPTNDMKNNDKPDRAIVAHISVDKELPVCAACGEDASFGARGDGPALQYPLDAGQSHPLADPNFGSVIFCSDKCAEARGFDPEGDVVPLTGEAAMRHRALAEADATVERLFDTAEEAEWLVDTLTDDLAAARAKHDAAEERWAEAEAHAFRLRERGTE